MRHTTQIELENQYDLVAVTLGVMNPEDVRRLTVTDALVDTGATGLCLPTSLIEQLGLTPIEMTRARTATGIVDRMLYSPVQFTVLERTSLMQITDLPEGSPVLVGHMVLEHLDLCLDIKEGLIYNPAHDGEWITEILNMTEPDNFANHNIHLETERLILRPFKDADFDVAVPFYNDPDFLQAMEDEPPDEPITKDYLRSAGEYMRKDGFLFAIVEKASGRTIGEVCLQWMNLERGKIDGEKIMRLPIGIWDKTLWGKGYGKEVVRCLVAHAFEKLEIDRFCPMDVRADNAPSKALWQSLGFVVSRELDDGMTLDFEMTRADYEKINQKDT